MSTWAITPGPQPRGAGDREAEGARLRKEVEVCHGSATQWWRTVGSGRSGVAIYVAVGAVVYLIVYLSFLAHGGSGGGVY